MRRAFTLIEVLVVVAILGLLAALLLPAVQSAREASRKAQCLNNLRQVGIALSGYESSQGTLPPPSMSGFSVHSRLLPYLDQVVAANQITFGDDPMLGANLTVSSLRLAVLLCPTDDGFNRPFTWTNYAANLGTSGPRQDVNGAFRWTGTRLSEITDGTSQTIAFAELVLGPVEPSVRDLLGNVLRIPIYDPSIDSFTLSCQTLNPLTTDIETHWKGRNWIESYPGCTTYNHYIAINGRSCRNPGYGAWTAGSRHTGGANTLFADGHATFMAETTSLANWRALERLPTALHTA